MNKQLLLKLSLQSLRSCSCLKSFAGAGVGAGATLGPLRETWKGVGDAGLGAKVDEIHDGEVGAAEIVNLYARGQGVHVERRRTSADAADAPLERGLGLGSVQVLLLLIAGETDLVKLCIARIEFRFRIHLALLLLCCCRKMIRTALDLS